MISQYTKLAKVEPIADVGFDFFAKAAQYKSEKIQQSKSVLQSTLSGFVNNVDILKEDDRQYFNEKVKNVVDNLNNFKDVDLSDPNTTYQLQSMLGEVKQDSRVLDSVLSTSNFRNVQKEHNLMISNPKFKDLFHQDLFKGDQMLMQEYINTPGAKYTQQHASINPKIEEQLEAGFKSITERKQVDIVGENIVTRTIKDQNLLYANGMEVANKNSDFYYKTFDVKFDLKNNPNQAKKGIINMLDAESQFYNNKKLELETALTTTNNPSLYTNSIKMYEDKLNKIKTDIQTVKESEDINTIKNIGVTSYMYNTALQQASKGYSYISNTKWSEQDKLREESKQAGVLLSLKNQMDIASDAREFAYQMALKEKDFQKEITIAGIKNIKKNNSNSPLSDEFTENDITKTVIENQQAEDVNYYQENKKKRVVLYNEMIGLQKDLVKIMAEQASINPKIKAVLEKYPDMGSQLYGEKSLKSILATTNMLSSMSGDRLENGATAEGAMKILNQIKEKTLLFNLNKAREETLSKVTGSDESKYNKQYKELYGETTFKRTIPLEFLNNLDKDNRDKYDILIPDIKKGKILTKEGKVFDNSFTGKNKGEDILKKINWEKSEKGSFDVENLTLQINPKNDKGDLLSDEPVLIKVNSDFLNKMKSIGYDDVINKINKPNTEIDYYVKQPKNSEYLKVLLGQKFYLDNNKAPNIPKGSILEYSIKNVKDPIPSAGDSRKDYTYDVELNIKGQPYTFNVNSTAEIHKKIDNVAIGSKEIAKSQFLKENKQPTVKELEERTFKIFIESLKKIK